MRVSLMPLIQNKMKISGITRETRSHAANRKLSENVRFRKVFAKLQENKPPLPIP